MKRLRIILCLTLGIIFCLPLAVAQAKEGVGGDCSYKGVPLRGRVKVVDSFATFRVQKVTAFADLRVKEVKTAPAACGEWQFVEAFPDFTVQFVEALPDFKVEFVGAFPGVK